MSFLSVDIGSSRSKAAIFSCSGEMFAARSIMYEPRIARPGFAELDPEQFFTSVTALIRQVTSLSKESVEAICFSSHGETIVPCTADGRPAGAAILNMDLRAEAEARWLEDAIGRKQIFAKTGLVSHAMYPVPKLLWLRRNAPEIFSSATVFPGITGFFLAQLGLPPLADYSHAARYLALDIHRYAWWEEMLSAAGIPASKLPEPVPTGTVAGRLNSEAAAVIGVPTGTPAVVGGHDQVMGAVGMGVLDGQAAAASLGSYDCLLAVSDQPVLNQAALRAGLNTYPHAVPGKYATIAYFPAGVMMQWLLHLLYEELGDDADRFAKLEAAAPDRPSGLLVTPHLIGSCNPEFDAQARAAMAGISISSTRADLFKGALEGIASEFALVAACLKDSGLDFDEIRVFGGGTRSPLGLRLRAALSNSKLRTMQCDEAVCLGGAMLAAVASGTYRNLGAAAAAMVHEQSCVSTDTALRAEYAEQLARYHRLRATTVSAPGTTVGAETKPIQHTGEWK